MPHPWKLYDDQWSRPSPANTAQAQAPRQHMLPVSYSIYVLMTSGFRTCTSFSPMQAYANSSFFFQKARRARPSGRALRLCSTSHIVAVADPSDVHDLSFGTLEARQLRVMRRLRLPRKPFLEGVSRLPFGIFPREGEPPRRVVFDLSRVGITLGDDDDVRRHQEADRAVAVAPSPVQFREDAYVAALGPDLHRIPRVRVLNNVEALMMTPRPDLVYGRFSFPLPLGFRSR
ncbi:hypothetical protein [Ktedonospora formicarum]|uniref:hypothetical protein n=1 Tax=Ktedonospora formicarum TaxID=2778364 RepID=UPI001C6897D3|nr:hypothetical protein [Ktedonospora formicarum]